MPDFAALPPEVNSGLMYTGPGSGPMLAAAAAWDALAAELESTAAGYSSVLSGLTGQEWSGPSSAGMATAAAPYVAWLQDTAAQAEQTAAQAKEAAVAYEAAFAMTVPPPVIAANRTTLMALIATNFFGQNTPAIAATEAHYAEMWAQDAAAMYGYAGASSSATTLTPFSAPPATTDPAGQDAQAAAVAHAVGSATGGRLARLTRLTSAMPVALQQLSSSGAATSPAGVPLFGSTSLLGLTTVFGSQGLLGPTFLGQSAVNYPYNAVNYGFFRANSQINLGSRIADLDSGNLREAESEARFAQEQAKKGGGLAAGLGTARPVSVSAGMGQARLMGSLSAPSGWAGEPVVIRPTSLALPNTGVVAAAPAAEPLPGSVCSQALTSALTNDAARPVHPKSKPVLVRNPASERGGYPSTRS